MNLIRQMLSELPFSADELNELVSTAPYRYKVFKIEKRKKNTYRTIAQPTPEIKLIQRWLIGGPLSSLPIHRVATAYREGRSIADHAAKHVQKRFLLKMDFENFFPSIVANDVEIHLSRMLHLPKEDIRIVRQLVCWRDKSTNRLCLSIGAPSSPFLSNTMLYTFDQQVVSLAKELGVTYTRYADDLAFSTNRKGVLSELPAQIEALCQEISLPKLTINKNKTVFTSKAQRRSLVGLILSSEGKVSLGRDKKRALRSALYRYSKGQMKVEEIGNLRGSLSFAWSVEPTFIQSLLRQVGADVFQQLDLPFK